MIKKKSYRFYGTDPLQHNFKRDIDSRNIQSLFPNLAYTLAGIQYGAILSGGVSSEFGKDGDTCSIGYDDKSTYFDNVVSTHSKLKATISSSYSNLQNYFSKPDQIKYVKMYNDIKKYKDYIMNILYPTADSF